MGVILTIDNMGVNLLRDCDGVVLHRDPPWPRARHAQSSMRPAIRLRGSFRGSCEAPLRARRLQVGWRFGDFSRVGLIQPRRERVLLGSVCRASCSTNAASRSNDSVQNRSSRCSQFTPSSMGATSILNHVVKYLGLTIKLSRSSVRSSRQVTRLSC
jgi:hypothetical protein